MIVINFDVKHVLISGKEVLVVVRDGNKIYNKFNTIEDRDLYLAKIARLEY